MIIYNVTVKIEPERAQEWLSWMKEEHMPDLIKTGLFKDARLCRLLQDKEEDGPTFVAQYFCADRAAYDAYISDYADEMRQRGLARFGNKFVAFRTLMEVVE